jgi:broad specificity phosphatase PhoE
MPLETAGSVRDLLFCRHGETQWNRERRIMGALDVPLSDAGRRQCASLGALLRDFGVDRIVSSPLARAAETAHALSAIIGAGVSYDDDLEEVRFGCWQGKTYEEIARDPAYDEYARDPVACATPGGESLRDVQRRGLAAVERLPTGVRTLVVSHGDLIRATLCHFLALPLTEFRRLRIDNCSLSAVRVEAGRVEVKFLNLVPDPERVWERLHWSRTS